MSRKRRAQLRALVDELARQYPEVPNPAALIESGAVRVDGWVRTSLRTRIRVGASITIAVPRELRGEAKLRSALVALAVDVRERIAVDVGAAAGGFTQALLRAGAAKVYAVDAGYGQLRGALRQDQRVVNLERTNLGDLDRRLVPDPIDVVTIDLSYLALAAAVPQLDRIGFARDADGVMLVKPQFELRRPAQPASAELPDAVATAAAALRTCGWQVVASVESEVRGARGSVEFFVHARRGGPGRPDLVS
jgi:23S rRNA (cytidine1920-2'-O)/16S rRNA (cytidine1409-2'-O)-methyltransferase